MIILSLTGTVISQCVTVTGICVSLGVNGWWIWEETTNLCMYFYSIKTKSIPNLSIFPLGGKVSESPEKTHESYKMLMMLLLFAGFPCQHVVHLGHTKIVHSPR